MCMKHTALARSPALLHAPFMWSIPRHTYVFVVFFSQKRQCALKQSSCCSLFLLQDSYSTAHSCIYSSSQPTAARNLFSFRRLHRKSCCKRRGDHEDVFCIILALPSLAVLNMELKEFETTTPHEQFTKELAPQARRNPCASHSGKLLAAHNCSTIVLHGLSQLCSLPR